VIKVRLSATGLAAARFAVSPLYEAMGLLLAMRAGRVDVETERAAASLRSATRGASVSPCLGASLS